MVDRDTAIERWIETLTPEEMIAIRLADTPAATQITTGAKEIWGLIQDFFCNSSTRFVLAGEPLRMACEKSLVTYFDQHTEECLKKVERRYDEPQMRGGGPGSSMWPFCGTKR